jgi:hypothetical protein
MNINFTKKPMKPITTKPRAVLEQIRLNSAAGERQQEANHQPSAAVSLDCPLP